MPTTPLMPVGAASAWSIALDEGPAGQVASTARVRHAAAIVLIVAMAVVLVAGIVSFSLVAYQCIKHGYKTVAAYGPNGWKVWQMRIVCTK